MFRFANSELLYLLLVIPAFILIYVVYIYIQKRALARFSESRFFDSIMPLRSLPKSHFKFLLFLVALTSLIIAVARPQFGSKLEEVKREGIEMIIALDVSRSMLAEDIKPNRLVRAKQAITTLVNRMQSDKIGMIVFAGDAYTQLPITTDYISAKLFLENISPSIVSRQGTAIGSAIELGVRSFTQDTEADKVIVIISDGENHEGDAVKAAEQATEKGIRVYTIGMGSREGTPIPVFGMGGTRQGFLKDRNGQTVMSKMDPQMLNRIARAGNGEFYRATTSNVGLNKLYSELNKLQKSEIETKTYSEYEDQFEYFIAFAIILLLVDILVFERKNKYLKDFSFFRK